MKLGPYEIVGPLGAGGMGEVYKARDTRLDRTVAIKVLPEHRAENPDLRARFEREARAVSALSHPHICALYDVGEATVIASEAKQSDPGATDRRGPEPAASEARRGLAMNGAPAPGATVQYLVMEYLEGETLLDRLDKGPLPIDQVLKVGVQITDALDRAHKQGIIHRDLKPGNVMLTKSGVKLLDFGLAKHRAAAARSEIEGLSSLPTAAPESRPLTEKGTIVGTFQYLSPEQLEGKEADSRSDIFALGSVLYEMATGQRAFTGKSRLSLVTSILRDEPRPISSISPMTPPALDRVVKTCLAKDPEDRFQTAHDVKLQLEWIAEAGSQAGAPAVVVSERKTRERLAWIVAGIAAAAAAALGIGFLRRSPKPPRVIRTSVELPAGAIADGQNDSLALSPDGRTMAVATADLGGNPRQIYLRALDGATMTPLAGTDGASSPFWSPDGRWLGFFAGGKLAKVEASGGAVQTICDAPQGRGAAWNTDGKIVFAGNVFGPLSIVPAAGGAPSPAEPDPGAAVSHRNPFYLPGGRAVLYFSLNNGKESENGVFALDLSSRRSRLVMRGASEGRYVEPGYFAFVRDRNVMIQRFDPKNLRLSGDAVPIAENVQFDPFRGTALYAFAGPELLVFQQQAPLRLSQLTWYGADGRKGPTVGDPAGFRQLSISPDGKRAVAGISGSDGVQLWMIDLTRGVASRFTFGVSGIGLTSAWSPDGRRVAYDAFLNSANLLQIRDADGGSPARTVLTSPDYVAPQSWTPDGQSLICMKQSVATKSWDVSILPLAGKSELEPLLASPANETAPALSPDGRWLAYLSDESGKDEVYLAPYPGPGSKWQITSGGTRGFEWAADDELLTVSPDGKIFAIELAPSGSGLRIGASKPAFGDLTLPANLPVAYDRAGKRWLLGLPTGESAPTPIALVTNWAAALEKR